MAQAQSPSRRSTPGRQSRIDPERKISVPRGQPAGVSPTLKGSRSIQVGRRGVFHPGVRDDPAVRGWPLDRTGSNRSSIGLVDHRPRARWWMPPATGRSMTQSTGATRPGVVSALDADCPSHGEIIGVSSFFGEKKTDTNNPTPIIRNSAGQAPQDRRGAEVRPAGFLTISPGIPAKGQSGAGIPVYSRWRGIARSSHGGVLMTSGATT